MGAVFFLTFSCICDNYSNRKLTILSASACRGRAGTDGGLSFVDILCHG